MDPGPAPFSSRRVGPSLLEGCSVWRSAACFASHARQTSSTSGPKGSGGGVPTPMTVMRRGARRGMASWPPDVIPLPGAQEQGRELRRSTPGGAFGLPDGPLRPSVPGRCRGRTNNHTHRRPPRAGVSTPIRLSRGECPGTPAIPSSAKRSPSISDEDRASLPLGCRDHAPDFLRDPFGDGPTPCSREHRAGTSAPARGG